MAAALREQHEAALARLREIEAQMEETHTLEDGSTLALSISGTRLAIVRRPSAEGRGFALDAALPLEEAELIAKFITRVTTPDYTREP